MFCNKCGKQIKAGNKFCEGCGTPVSAVPVASAAPVSSIAVPVNQPVAASSMAAPAAANENVSLEMRQCTAGRAIRKAYPNTLWMKECPIRITECVIADKDAEGNIALFLQVENLASTVIEGIFFDVKGFDILKAEKCNIENIACIDLRILPNQKAIIPTTIDLTDKLIRKVAISVRHVVFEDETIWDYEGKDTLTAVSYEQTSVAVEYLADLDIMAKELTENNYGMEKYPYYAITGDGYWVCACGQFNYKDKCNCCGEAKDVITKNFTKDVLAAKKQARIEKEEQEIAERKAREEAERKAAEERARIAAEEARRAEEERQRIAAEEAKKAEEERKRQEEMARIRAEEEAKLKAEVDAKKAEEDAKKAEEDAKKAEEAAKKAEEAKAEAEAVKAAKAEEEAKRAKQLEEQMAAVKALKNEKVNIAPSNTDDDDDKTMPAPGLKMTAPASSGLAFCTGCGTKLIPGNLFCTGCGKKI